MEDNGRILMANLKASEKFQDNLLTGAICFDVFKDKRMAKLVYEYQGKRYLNIKVVKRKVPSQYGKTHYIEVDMFVPVSRLEGQEQVDLTK